MKNCVLFNDWCTSLEDQTGVVTDPLGVAGNAGETIGITAVQAETRAEADESDLIVDTLAIHKAQWATRVTLPNKIKHNLKQFQMFSLEMQILNYVARSLVVNASFDAKDIVADDGSVNGGAFSSGDTNNGGLVEGRRNGATNYKQK